MNKNKINFQAWKRYQLKKYSNHPQFGKIKYHLTYCENVLRAEDYKNYNLVKKYWSNVISKIEQGQGVA